MEKRFFTKKHLWMLKDGDTVSIGISDFLQEKLGSIIFLNLPEKGDLISVGECFGDVESKKTVMDMGSPVSGEVVEVNEEVGDEPGIINEAPYDSWLIKVRIKSFPDDLMDEDAYNRYIMLPWMQNH